MTTPPARPAAQAPAPAHGRLAEAERGAARWRAALQGAARSERPAPRADAPARRAPDEEERALRETAPGCPSHAANAALACPAPRTAAAPSSTPSARPRAAGTGGPAVPPMSTPLPDAGIGAGDAPAWIGGLPREPGGERAFALVFPASAWPLLRAEAHMRPDGMALHVIVSDRASEARVRRSAAALQTALGAAGYRLRSLRVERAGAEA